MTPPPAEFNHWVLTEEHAPFSAFVPYFEDRRDAAWNFATGYQQYFIAEVAEGSCIRCGNVEATWVVHFSWRARVLDKLGFTGRLPHRWFRTADRRRLRARIITYSTYHPVCRRCVWRMRLARGLGVVLAFLFLFLSLVAVIPIAAFFVEVFDKRAADVTLVVGAGIFAVMLTVAGVLLFRAGRRSLCPKSIRFLTEGPFQIQKRRYRRQPPSATQD